MEWEAARSLAEEAAGALAPAMSGVVALDFPIGPLTTFRLGGAAALYVEPDDAKDLESAKSVLAGCGLEVLVLGRGSNLLVSDQGFAGVAIRLGAGFNWIDGSGGAVAAGAATPLPTLARWCADRCLTGMEFGVGIPASVGGAVRMNAGGHGREMSEVLVSANLCDLDGADAEVPVGDFAYGYRRSSLGPRQIVTSARFSLTAGDEDSIRQRMAEITRWRRENQPGGSPNAGSMFKNPANDSAGRLIDSAGLKGFQVGGARVSQKHANFFLAEPSATASDVDQLMRKVREIVATRSGIVLEPEVRRVGAFAEWPVIGDPR